MLVRLKNGDDYLEVDSELSNDQIGTFEKMSDVSSLDDTLEISVNELFGDENGK